MEKVKRVHMVYKTHLDIGFTDFASNIVDNYVNVFIPKAISLAEKINTENKKLFVWSVGSWLIDYYLKHAKEESKEILIKAIKDGNIVWHGLPFTTHTELMNGRLVDYGISLSQKLDNIFATKTIASKMTDVPGHTIGLVKHLAKADISYIHLGVNDASHKPDVPDTFVWQDSKGNEIIVDYCQGYGDVKQLPFMEDVLAFCHSGDNLGPPTLEEVVKNYETLQAKFPEAEVFASDLNQYAKALVKHKDKLPILNCEIGDTWIHGVMTDPFKTGLFKEYLSIMEKLILEKRVLDKELESFLDSMLLIPEHTWGLDVKKYLSDYKNWSKKDFVNARLKDKLDDSMCIPEYESCYVFAKEEFARQIKNLNWVDRSYSIFEKSHQEQREYLDKAIETLTEENKNIFVNAKEDYKTMSISKDIYSYNQVKEKQLIINDYLINVEDNSQVFVNNIPLGYVSYEIFGTETFERYKSEYGFEYDKNYDWAMPDNFKCGYEFCGATKNNVLYAPKLNGIYVKDNKLIVKSSFDSTLADEQGCPRDVYALYTFFDNSCTIELNLQNKDANRMPEALWFTLLDGYMTKPIELVKLGEVIDPYNVALGGNRNHHAIEKIITSNIEITPHHTPLISLGERRLYDFNQQYADPIGGVNFNIYNNLWNTNFKMWYEEDIKTIFEVIFTR